MIIIKDNRILVSKMLLVSGEVLKDLKLKIDIAKARAAILQLKICEEEKCTVVTNLCQDIRLGNLYLFYIFSSKTNCDIHVYVSGFIDIYILKKFVDYNTIILFIV